MGTKRDKKKIITGVSRELAEKAFTEYAKAVAEENRLTADMEMRMVKLRDSYSMELTLCRTTKAETFEVLQSYAMEHREELFSKKKSLEMAQGTIGFRTGTPKLKTVKGFTWASALTLVKKFLPGYVRQTEEVAKDKLLADRDLNDVPIDWKDIPFSRVPMSKAMAECGLEVVQNETFYVEPKSEDADGPDGRREA